MEQDSGELRPPILETAEQDAPGVIAVIPMKPLEDSKTRLRRNFTPKQREDLALGMLRRVLMAVRAASLDAFWVVGGDRRVLNLTRNSSGMWLEDLSKNLNETVSKAFGQVFERRKSAMYLAADLPFLKPSDIHSLIQASRRQINITLAPARRDGGTNAILVPAGIPFFPELGPRRFTKHLSQAAKLGVSVAICSSPGLGFDLDTPEDLETYEHMEPGLLGRLMPDQAPVAPDG